MIENKNIVAATRLNTHSIAQARDRLITIGYDPTKLLTISSILKVTFLYGLSKLFDITDDIPPSEESLHLISKTNQIVPRKNR